MGQTVSLIEVIAQALYDESAYRLPAVCIELGLAGGETQEAMSGKIKYVENRLKGKTPDELLRLAREVATRYPHFGLEEAIANATPDEVVISEITRRNILHDLNSVHLPGRLGVIECLTEVFPLQKLPRYGGFAILNLTLEDEIAQHTVRNDDWDNETLFAALNLLQVSQTRFLRFLERLVQPVVRQGDEQQQVAATINKHLEKDGLHLVPAEETSGFPVYRVVRVSGGQLGRGKNIIFAAINHKPEIVLADAINNDIRVVKHADNCLIFDRPIPSGGLLWTHLIEWWANKENLDATAPATAQALGARLKQSLSSAPERILFGTYFKKFKPLLEDKLPALVPQVYLHYDPYTAKQITQKRLARQRMDFLLLPKPYVRIVIEVDGKHHYAEGDKASPKLYAEMVVADRDLRLAGYEIYRFGGVEFASNSGAAAEEFFSRLFQRHGLLSNG